VKTISLTTFLRSTKTSLGSNRPWRLDARDKRPLLATAASGTNFSGRKSEPQFASSDQRKRFDAYPRLEVSNRMSRSSSAAGLRCNKLSMMGQPVRNIAAASCMLTACIVTLQGRWTLKFEI
jgi:hypothetical protein